METIDYFINSVTNFHNELRSVSTGRYHSWEHCDKAFHEARDSNNANTDYLSLQLAFYLASWGMYRGSSFLLQQDYKVHIPVVKEILNPKYDKLFGIKCSDLKQKSAQTCLTSLAAYMVSYYDRIRKSVTGVDVKCKLSNTLITKILMGSLGCVPAYDRYFIDGVKFLKATTGTYSINSLMRLVDFYEKNEDQLEDARSSFCEFDLPYPQMKILDMGFWQIGYERDMRKGL